MKVISMCVALLLQVTLQAQEKFQLAPPLIQYSSTLIKDSVLVSIHFNQPGAEVRYTLNGTEPGNKSLRYQKPIVISQPGTLLVKAMGKHFISSETIRISFNKAGLPVKDISYSQPNQYYAQLPKNILFDGMSGNCNFRSGTWLGFDSDTVRINVVLQNTEQVNRLFINLLQDEDSWIFLPRQILVYYKDTSTGHFLPFGKETFQHEGPSPKGCSLRVIERKEPVSGSEFLIEIYVLDKIPDWHNAKGSHSWLFVDEIFVR